MGKQIPWNDYVNASDLAKLRIAKSVLRSVYGYTDEINDMVIKLGGMTEQLEKMVRGG